MKIRREIRCAFVIAIVVSMSACGESAMTVPQNSAIGVSTVEEVSLPIASAKAESNKEPSTVGNTRKPPINTNMDAYKLIALLVEELPTLSTREQFRSFRAQAQGVHGATDATSDSSSGYELQLLFEPPLDARRVAEVLGVRSGYLVSGDVHQREFCIMSCTGVLQTRYFGLKRIVAERPKRGVWWMNASGPRPEGPLPNVSSGASPAYPLSSYNTAIKQLIIMRTRD